MNTNTTTKTKTVSKKAKKVPSKTKVGPKKTFLVSKKYLSTYNSEISKLKKIYKNIKMCCDDQNQLVNLIKDVEKIMEMKKIEPHLGKLYKELDNKIENFQRKKMMINILRIFLDDDYYSTKEKKERMKKFIEEKSDIKFKDKCVNVGKE